MPFTVPRTIAALLLALAAPAFAQSGIGSEGYRFLEAVRKGDGAEANKFMSVTGSTIINAKDVTSGEGALHIVTAQRDLGWINLLTARGAKVDIRDKQGRTPLMIAAELGFAEGAELLIDRRAQVDLANNRGETPLIRAVQRRDLRMVRMLLEAGANPDKADTLAGQSARDYATIDRRNASVLRLIEATPRKARAKVGP